MPATGEQRAEAIRKIAEVFREHGYEGASLQLITARTGLGKGSLYHFFPSGKAGMAEAVLDEIGGWFEASVFRPLREAPDGAAGIAAMLDAVDAYFASGRRICLVGAFALSDTRDLFAARVNAYFEAWRAALAAAMARAGAAAPDAEAQDALALIQGGILLARAEGSAEPFAAIIGRLRVRYATPRHGAPA